MKNRQRGLTFIGLVSVSVVVAGLGLVLVQVVPTLIEYQAISKAAKRAAGGSTVAEVRTLFDKAATIDDFTSVKGSDLDISKDNDRVIVKFAYEREIHLAGPAWLVMRYSGSSQ
jgi:Tfp pilus assembly protein PilE